MDYVYIEDNDGMFVELLQYYTEACRGAFLKHVPLMGAADSA
jgi:hypothetical protein